MSELIDERPAMKHLIEGVERLPTYGQVDNDALIYRPDVIALLNSQAGEACLSHSEGKKSCLSECKVIERQPAKAAELSEDKAVEVMARAMKRPGVFFSETRNHEKTLLIYARKAFRALQDIAIITVKEPGND